MCNYSIIKDGSWWRIRQSYREYSHTFGAHSLAGAVVTLLIIEFGKYR